MILSFVRENGADKIRLTALSKSSSPDNHRLSMGNPTNKECESEYYQREKLQCHPGYQEAQCHFCILFPSKHTSPKNSDGCSYYRIKYR